MKIIDRNTVIDLSSLSREELEKRVVDLTEKLMSAEAKNEWYLQAFKKAQAARFGRKSEKLPVPGQISLEELFSDLFNESEAFREMINTEPKPEDLPEDESRTPKKRKGRGKGKDLSGLETKTETFELTGEDLICPQCGSELHEIKTEVRTEIEVIPAQTVVHRYETKVYGCRNCEKKGKPVFIKAPGAPEPFLKGSPVTAAYIAWLIYCKFVLATPFYRLEQDNIRNKIPITRNNMCNWVIRATIDWLQLIFDRMHGLMMQMDILHSDETEVQVLHEPGREATTKSRMWVTTTAESEKEMPMALYHYSETRAAYEARKILKGFSGYIMCDGYAVYPSLAKKGKNGEPPMDIIPVACLVHIEREFKDTLKAVKPEDVLKTHAQKAVNMLSAISHVDNQWDGLPYEERYEQRLKVLKPMFDEFYAFIDEERQLVLPKCQYGKAITYAYNQKEKVYNIFLDGRLELNNSMAERAVKPFVTGRKNWLFSNTPGGANASSVDYSIVETAKMNNLNPYRYIRYLLETMPKINVCNYDELDRLLPWSQDLPDYVRVSQ